MKIGFGGFYKDGLKHRGATKITELFYPLKLLVFMDLGMLLIVVILGWFRGVEIIVYASKRDI